MTNNLKLLIEKSSKKFGLDPSKIAAFIQTETGGQGFDQKTGKIMIQFEPSWMKKQAPYTPSGKWSLNGVEKQVDEWIAFNDAFARNANAAMEATSIGLGQILGIHWKLLGFRSVGEMWDFSKKSLENQIDLICLFIISNTKLLDAVVIGDWHTVALIYNGAKYKEMAAKWGRKMDYAQEMQYWYNIFK